MITPFKSSATFLFFLQHLIGLLRFYSKAQKGGADKPLRNTPYSLMSYL